MTGLLLTKNTTPILAQFAEGLGWIINMVFNFLDSIGIPNIGLAIIIFTIIVYMLMIPLTYKQQKFSKMSAKMNPELQAVQKKYKGKSDQVSMMKMNEETKAVYAKYGTSPSGTCLPLLIQLPVLLALYRVIYAIPAYITKVKEVYQPVVDGILGTEGGSAFIQELSSAAQFQRQDFTLGNTIIDVLNKCTSTEWGQIAAQFPDMGAVIESARATLDGFNNFLGLNIANSPWFSIREYFAAGQYGWIVVALIIPILAGLTQWLNVKMMPQAANPGGEENAMMNSMKSVNNFMPLMSVYFCAVLPAGLGLYWIMSALVRTLQQLVINKYLDKTDIDAEIKKNMEKYNRKREKNGLPPEKLNNVARTNAKYVDTSSKHEITDEERQKSLQNSTEYYNRGAAAPGSLAAKARMVEQYNEKNKKNK